MATRDPCEAQKHRLRGGQQAQEACGQALRPLSCWEPLKCWHWRSAAHTDHGGAQGLSSSSPFQGTV